MFHPIIRIFLYLNNFLKKVFVTKSKNFPPRWCTKTLLSTLFSCYPRWCTKTLLWGGGDLEAVSMGGLLVFVRGKSASQINLCAVIGGVRRWLFFSLAVLQGRVLQSKVRIILGIVRSGKVSEVRARNRVKF